MAQADYIVSNGTGAAVRSDLNGQLAAIVSNNSGATSPATTYAYQWWADTTTNTLKLRNSANSAWIEIMQLDGTLTMEDGTAALPGLAFRDDLDTGIFRAGTNQLGISSAGVERVEFGSSEVVFNDAGNNYDFRVEGDTNANLLFVDASADAVGIGSSSPTRQLTVTGSTIPLRLETSDSNMAVEFVSNAGTRRNWLIGAQYNVNGAFEITPSTAIGNTTFSTPAIVIDSSSRVGIGTTPSYKLDVNTGSNDRVRIVDSASATLELERTGAKSYLIQSTGDSGLRVYDEDAGSERLRVDTSGRLLVGTSTAATTDNNANSPYIQLEGADGDASRLLVRSNAGTTASAGPVIYLSRSRGTTANSKTSVAADDFLGSIVFEGTDGTADRRAAAITAFVDATPGTNDMPGRLVFSTTADGASSPTERLRIANNGQLSAVVPGASTLFPGFLARAWVNFNGTGVVAIRASGNVSSITDNGVGDYTINFTTAMTDANYAATGMGMNEVFCQVIVRSTIAATASALRIVAQLPNVDVGDPTVVSVAVFR